MKRRRDKTDRERTSIYIAKDLLELVRGHDINLSSFVEEKLHEVYGISSSQLDDLIQERKEEIGRLKKLRKQRRLDVQNWERLVKDFSQRARFPDRQNLAWLNPQKLSRYGIRGMTPESVLEKLRIDIARDKEVA